MIVLYYSNSTNNGLTNKANKLLVNNLLNRYDIMSTMINTDLQVYSLSFYQNLNEKNITFIISHCLSNIYKECTIQNEYISLYKDKNYLLVGYNIEGNLIYYILFICYNIILIQHIITTKHIIIL